MHSLYKINFTLINLGTGFGLMSISVLIADCVLLNFTNKKNLFKRLKELDIQNNNGTNTTDGL